MYNNPQKHNNSIYDLLNFEFKEQCPISKECARIWYERKWRHRTSNHSQVYINYKTDKKGVDK